MHRATPLGHEQNAPTPEPKQHPENDTNNTPDPAATPAESNSDEAWARRFSIVRGGAPPERPRRNSGEEHRRRLTPTRAVIQPSDPERLRKALEALRAMNQLTRRRTEDMKKLSTLSRELSQQMTEFGDAVRGLKIGPQRRSVG